MSKKYHIDLDESINCETVLLPGDPGRVEKIAAKLEQAEFLGQHREYTTWRGKLEGKNLLVMSTGMGGPSTAIGVEELIQLGVKNFIRIGTCGGMDLEVKGGDIVIAQAAIRREGTSREYLPLEFPAVANLELTNALVKAAENLNLPYHVGVVHCKDSFYGQHSPETMPVAQQLLTEWESWLRAHTLASEMESSALFSVCQVRGVKAACVLQTIWNQEREKEGLVEEKYTGPNQGIDVALEAVKLLQQA
ncbi:MAG: uridine phosphorylase [Eubacteriales bacterium]|nr:uridine phosphorylase [Eubacteriales bacterium]